MNTGTAVFLITLLLVATFVSLGYIANSFYEQMQAINALKAENNALKSQNSEYEARIAQINDELTEERNQREMVENELGIVREQFENIQIACSQPGTENWTEANPKNQLAVPEWVPLTALAILLVPHMYTLRSNWSKLSATAYPSWGNKKATQAAYKTNETVKVSMTRQQLKSYLKHQREQGGGMQG